MKTTISILKADVGSIGGHTKPSARMIASVENDAQQAVKQGMLLDSFVSHTGDDIAIIMSHTRGSNDTEIHQFAWDSFIRATEIARDFGLYGAGQDLLVDAPSGNLRGAGPAVAEVEFDHEPVKTNRARPAESFMVLAADKCGPGAYNLPLFLGFADPMYCAGLMLPNMIQGFTFHIIDMDNTSGDSMLHLNAPDDYYHITALLRDNERFGIDSISSRTHDGQTAAAISAQRLHNVAGTYTGKDDPVAIVRNQGIFPAPRGVIVTLRQGPLRWWRCARLSRHASYAGAHQYRGYRHVLPAHSLLHRLLPECRRHVLRLLYRLLRQPLLGRGAAQGPREGLRHA